MPGPEENCVSMVWPWVQHSQRVLARTELPSGGEAPGGEKGVSSHWRPVLGVRVPKGTTWLSGMDADRAGCWARG